MSDDDFTGFKPSLLKFLRELEQNNNRPWFKQNKARYEADLLTPALHFIESMEPRVKTLSPYFDAIAMRSGGSLMRIYKDTRFSQDKTPYKTNVGIQFRHESGKDVHAPGYYVHIANDGCFLGAGIWRPESKALADIRDAIDENPDAWRKARDHKPFVSAYTLEGDSLKRAPKGYDPEHPLIEDLRRKDFIAVQPITKTALRRKDFSDFVTSEFRKATPLMRFLCNALDVAF